MHKISTDRSRRARFSALVALSTLSATAAFALAAPPTASGQPADTTDARVTVGGYKLSIPGRSAPGAAPSIVRPDGAIEIPSNTLGPGESLQHREERASLDRKQREADLRIAEARAENDERDRRNDRRRGIGLFGGFGGGYAHFAGGIGGYTGGYRAHPPIAPIHPPMAAAVNNPPAPPAPPHAGDRPGEPGPR